MSERRALVVGWFSFEQMGATAGDLAAANVVCEWLQAAGVAHDQVTAPPFDHGRSWDDIDPIDYTELVFVCGPFGNGPPITELLERFRHCRLVGVDVSMLQPLDEWQPFDVLLERDSSHASRPDLALAANTRSVPVVGLVLVHDQNEYGDAARHERANDVINAFLDELDAAVVRIDTRLDENATGLRTRSEVETLIARMDVIITTRLHGLVFGVTQGVPVIAIDPIAGGRKVLRQAQSLAWPIVFTADAVTTDDLRAAWNACTSPSISSTLREVRERAFQTIDEVREQFLAVHPTR